MADAPHSSSSDSKNCSSGPSGFSGSLKDFISAMGNLEDSAGSPSDDDSTIKTKKVFSPEGGGGRVELCRSDVLRLLSYLEGELQARDDVIATLKNEKAKELMYQAKYGRLGLNDPLCALQRDSEALGAEDDFEPTSVGQMYDWQLSQLEALIATQKNAAALGAEDDFEPTSVGQMYDWQLSQLEALMATQKNAAALGAEDDFEPTSVGQMYDWQLSQLEALMATQKNAAALGAEDDFEPTSVGQMYDWQLSQLEALIATQKNAAALGAEDDFEPTSVGQMYDWQLSQLEALIATQKNTAALGAEDDFEPTSVGQMYDWQLSQLEALMATQKNAAALGAEDDFEPTSVGQMYDWQLSQLEALIATQKNAAALGAEDDFEPTSVGQMYDWQLSQLEALIATQKNAAALGAEDDFEPTSVGQMYDWQLSQLEALIATQKNAAVRMRQTLSATERKHARAIRELSTQLERAADRKVPRDLKTALDNLQDVEEKLRTTETELEDLKLKQSERDSEIKSMVVFLVQERNELVESVMAERSSVEALKEQIEKSTRSKLLAELVEPLKQRLTMSVAETAQLKSQLAACQTELSQLRQISQEKDEQLNALRQSFQAAVQEEQLKVVVQQRSAGRPVLLQRSSSGTNVPTGPHGTPTRVVTSVSPRYVDPPPYGSPSGVGSPRNRSSYSGATYYRPPEETHVEGHTGEYAHLPPHGKGATRVHYVSQGTDHRRHPKGMLVTSHETVFAAAGPYVMPQSSPVHHGQYSSHMTGPIYSNPAAPDRHQKMSPPSPAPTGSLRRGQRRDVPLSPEKEPTQLKQPQRGFGPGPSNRPQGIYVPGDGGSKSGPSSVVYAAPMGNSVHGGTLRDRVVVGSDKRQTQPRSGARKPGQSGRTPQRPALRRSISDESATLPAVSVAVPPVSGVPAPKVSPRRDNSVLAHEIVELEAAVNSLTEACNLVGEGGDALSVAGVVANPGAMGHVNGTANNTTMFGSFPRPHVIITDETTEERPIEQSISIAQSIEATAPASRSRKPLSAPSKGKPKLPPGSSSTLSRSTAGIAGFFARSRSQTRVEPAPKTPLRRPTTPSVATNGHSPGLPNGRAKSRDPSPAVPVNKFTKPAPVPGKRDMFVMGRRRAVKGKDVKATPV